MGTRMRLDKKRTPGSEIADAWKGMVPVGARVGRDEEEEANAQSHLRDELFLAALGMSHVFLGSGDPNDGEPCIHLFGGAFDCISRSGTHASTSLGTQGQ